MLSGCNSILCRRRLIYILFRRNRNGQIMACWRLQLSELYYDMKYGFENDDAMYAGAKISKLTSWNEPRHHGKTAIWEIADILMVSKCHISSAGQRLALQNEKAPYFDASQMKIYLSLTRYQCTASGYNAKMSERAHLPAAEWHNYFTK